MVKMVNSVLFLAATALHLLTTANVVLGHPGEDPLSPENHDASLKKQAFSHMVSRMSNQALVSACGSRPEDVAARQERAMERRFAKFQELREKKNLGHLPSVSRRTNADFARYNSISHNQTGLRHLDVNTPSKDVFAANTSCVLTPDNVDGPYFVWGEDLRSDITEGLPGIPLHLELQFIDAVLIDIWACNADGVYSGVSAEGQGGLNSTFLRGVQMSNAEGVVDFDTIFPGHYFNRATHQHIIAHAGAQRQPNGSYTGGHAAHVSQLFFDQALIHQVEQTAPYNANTVPLTTNDVDAFTGYAATPTYDTFVEYVLVGDGQKHSDIVYGVFAWAELAINTSLNYDSFAAPAAFRYGDGNVDNKDFFEEQLGGPVAPPTHG